MQVADHQREHSRSPSRMIASSTNTIAFGVQAHNSLTQAFRTEGFFTPAVFVLLTDPRSLSAHSALLRISRRFPILSATQPQGFTAALSDSAMAVRLLLSRPSCIAVNSVLGTDPA
jgi:hypothetical protein